ncbi:MAG: creatininase family protein [Chloroflexi bacterium]|nr:creatininase family protein [Chloroflexota bacterium]
MPLMHAEEITYSDVQRFDRQRSIAFLSVSALEVHGPHLPLGMDMFMARWQAEETARRFAEAHRDWHAVLYPHLPLGTDELPLPGSIDGLQQTVYRALLAHGASLAKAGFCYAVVTNGHGGARHASAIEAACRAVSRRHRIQMFSPSIAVLYGIVAGGRHDQLEANLGRPLTDKERDGLLHGEHAGTMETSFALAERPDQVDPAYRELETDGPPPFRPLAAVGARLAPLFGGNGGRFQEISSGLAGGVGWLLNAHYGYGRPYRVTYQGDPSAASAELGHAIRETMVQGCLEYVERVTGGALAAADVRSIASEPAIIQPGFWQRLGLIAAGALGAAAFLWALRRQEERSSGRSMLRPYVARPAVTLMPRHPHPFIRLPSVVRTPPAAAAASPLPPTAPPPRPRCPAIATAPAAAAAAARTGAGVAPAPSRRPCPGPYPCPPARR